MAKKLEKCCFCGKASLGSNLNKWGAWNEDTNKYLCVDCIVTIFEGVMEEVEQYEMDQSVKSEMLGTNTDAEADGIPHKEV